MLRPLPEIQRRSVDNGPPPVISTIRARPSVLRLSWRKSELRSAPDAPASRPAVHRFPPAGVTASTDPVRRRGRSAEILAGVTSMPASAGTDGPSNESAGELIQP